MKSCSVKDVQRSTHLTGPTGSFCASETLCSLKALHVLKVSHSSHCNKDQMDIFENVQYSSSKYSKILLRRLQEHCEDINCKCKTKYKATVINQQTHKSKATHHITYPLPIPEESLTFSNIFPVLFHPFQLLYTHFLTMSSAIVWLFSRILPSSALSRAVTTISCRGGHPLGRSHCCPVLTSDVGMPLVKFKAPVF